MRTVRRGRILIVDDTPRNVASLSDILAPEGYEILSAPTGELGLDCVEKENPDLILLDLVLPGIMGIEVLEQLRQTHPRTTVILTTAYGSEETAIQALRRGVNDYIINKRPFDPNEVREVVRRAILESQLRQENERLSLEIERVNLQLHEYASDLEKSVNELRSANEQLKQLDRVKASFFSMVSHELRHPITVARGYLELLATDDVGELGPQARQYVQIINQNLEQLSGMIEDLLDLSRIEAGSFQIQRQSVRASSIVGHVVQAFAARAADKKISLQSSVADDIPLLYADPARIVQVLSNLVDNAIKFTPVGGTITVDARLVDVDVHFLVQDTGIGIPESELDNIFERFYQIKRPDNGTTGAGLGLAICREIVRLHNGRIWAESEPAKGSRFVFTIPKAEEP